jgi:hypothetical protein
VIFEEVFEAILEGEEEEDECVERGTFVVQLHAS